MLPDITVAMLDRSHLDQTRQWAWNSSSPQHIPADALARLFPASFFDAAVAVLREPTARFQSAFLFQKHVQKTIGPSRTADEFVQFDLLPNVSNPEWCDGHFLPQSRFVPQNMPVALFRLENGGLGPVIEHLKALFHRRDWPSDIPRANATPDVRTDVTLTPDSQSLLNELYRDDLRLYADLSSQIPLTPLFPVGFDADTYLSLNPDVKASGMNAHHHYLLHGRHESRRWRDE